MGVRAFPAVLVVVLVWIAPAPGQGCSGRSEGYGSYGGCRAKNGKTVQHTGNDTLLRVGSQGHELLGFGQAPNLPAAAVVGAVPAEMILPGTSCRLVNDARLLLFGVSWGPDGRTRIPLPVPNDPRVGGLFFYSQFAWLESGANALSITTSRGLRQWVGRASGECYRVLETLVVGPVSIQLCQRDDGAFGLGTVRWGKTLLRRRESLVTWQIAGRFPRFVKREGLKVFLDQPQATLTFAPEQRRNAGHTFDGFSMQLDVANGPGGPIVERATWEIGGSTKGNLYFDGYRGWHAPPAWLPADQVPKTNPKLLPSLLHGTGFQFQQGTAGALLHFHTTLGDRLQNQSNGEALEFETSFVGPASVKRYILASAASDSAINLWTRGFEITHAELQKAFGIPPRPKDLLLVWPPFSNTSGFASTAKTWAQRSAQDGFGGAAIDTIWENATAHGGKKNLLTWDYTVSKAYGGEQGLAALMAECNKHKLSVVAWVAAGHLDPNSPVWKTNPKWVLRNDNGSIFTNPSGLWHGNLFTGFHDHYRNNVVAVLKKFGLGGLWLDTHLSYADQTPKRPNSEKLARIYLDFIQAGAVQLLAEGDASAIGSYGIAIFAPKTPPPDLFYGATMPGGVIDPSVYQNHFRAYVAAGAPWAVGSDFLYSPKLTGPAYDAARKETRQVIQDYNRVKSLMVHRFVRKDGSGYDWTNDSDNRIVTWLLKDSKLQNSQTGKAGQVYVLGR